MNTGDTVNGNGLTKVSLVLNGGAGAVAPVSDINNVASINVNAANNASNGAVINAVEFDGVAKIAVTNGTNGQFVNITGAQLDTVYSIEKDRSVTVDLQTFEDVAGAADNVQLNAVGAGTSTTAAAFDLSDNAVETVTLTTTGTNNVAINNGSLTSKYVVNGSGVNKISIDDAAGIFTVDASKSTATNVIDVNQNLSTGDTMIGGSGSDTLVADLGLALPILANVAGFETIDLEFSAAATYNAKNTVGADTLRLTPGTSNSIVTNLNQSVETIRFGNDAAISSAVTHSVTYATGAKSDVTLEIGATPNSGTTSVSVGAVTLAANKGGLEIVSGGSKANTIASVTANDVTSVVVGGVSQNLTI